MHRGAMPPLLYGQQASLPSSCRQAAGPRARLATTIMLNPDASLHKFLHADFAALRRLCAHVTLYADHSDNALFYSETFNREKALGKHPFDLVRPPHPPAGCASPGSSAARSALPDDPGVVSGACGLYRPGGMGSGGVGSGGAQPRTMRSALGAPQLLRSEPLVTSSTSSQRSDGSMVGGRGIPLDMDVIDTSWMDSNVRAMRHNFFNVNRWVVDDLREIIYTQKRARFRSGRLLHRSGNVWSFLAAPKHIVNP